MKTSAWLLLGLFNLVGCKAQSDFVILSDESTLNGLKAGSVIPESATATWFSETEFEEAQRILKVHIHDYNVTVEQRFKAGEKRQYARMYQIQKLENYRLQLRSLRKQQG